jgi:hypothetical protein
MKKIIFFLVVAILILFSISKLYTSPEKKMLRDFANDVINENVKLEKIIDKYIICDKRAIEINVLVLEHFRSEYKKRPSSVSVHTYKERKDDKIFEGLVSDNYEKVYLIDFGEKLHMSILLNKDSKIIAISTMNKGGTRFFIITGGN